MKVFALALVLLCQLGLVAQVKEKTDVHIEFGTYPAKLLIPSFKPIHPGLSVGVDYSWATLDKWKLQQTLNLGYFNHANIQKAVMLNSELGYHYHFANGLRINPISAGGGYVLSISDMTDLLFNEDLRQYEEVNSLRHNWMISLGLGAGYSDLFTFMERPVSCDAMYRIQIQGKVVVETVPMIAYTPLKIKFSAPLLKSSK